MFLNINSFSNFDLNCSNSLDLRNLQEQVKKAFVTKNCCVELFIIQKMNLNLYCFQVCRHKTTISSLNSKKKTEKTSIKSQPVSTHHLRPAYNKHVS